MVLTQVGATKNMMRVYQGVFTTVDTYGVPLDIAVELLKRYHAIVDWPDFFQKAIKAGWNRKTAYSKILMALSDTYGKEYAEHVVNRLKVYG